MRQCPDALADPERSENVTGEAASYLPGELRSARLLAAVATATAATVIARRARLTRRGVLCPLDQHVGHHEPAVLVLGDELEADPTPSLSTSCTITSTMSPRAITSSMCATRPGPTFETWSRPSVPFLSSTKAPNSVVLTTFPV